MSASDLFTFSLRPIGRFFRRWWLILLLAHKQMQIEVIQANRENDFKAEKALMADQAAINSELNRI